MNGIVASFIPLSSPEIVFTRTLIGSVFLVLVFAASRQPLRFWRNKRHFLYLAISGMAMGISWVFLFGPTPKLASAWRRWPITQGRSSL